MITICKPFQEYLKMLQSKQAQETSMLFSAMAPIASLLLFLLVYLVLFIQVTSQDLSFTMELLHRDSPMSPLYTPHDTPYEMARKSIQRSHFQVKNFRRSQIQPDVIPDHGIYLLNISIGTPPVDLLGFVDTGSDITWTQCEPCESCYNQSIAIFNPKNSSTFRDHHCPSQTCHALDAVCDDGKCFYHVIYGDWSITLGTLATETLTMTSNPLPEILFGCGHTNGGPVYKYHRGSGLIGLGGGPYSLISQLDSRINGKFSYCFIPYNLTTSSSKMSFGQDAVVTGDGVVSTAFVQKEPKTFYFLTLEGVTVEGKKIPYYLGSSNSNTIQEGNIIIDSGTTLTLLPSVFYNEFETSIKSAIKLVAVGDPQGLLRLCYKVAILDHLGAPQVTFHFKGADVVLKPKNLFIEIEEGLMCLGILPADETQTPIYGNFAQINFLVGYDRKARTVSFKPTDCTNK